MQSTVMDYRSLMKFYRKKRILITGHTGFKGTWLTKILLNAGANVCGYSLNPLTNPNIFDLSKIVRNPNLIHIVGDIRNLEMLKSVVCEFQPEVVMHLAAQPIVRESYRNPVDTYSINIMGTVNLLESIRISGQNQILGERNWNGVQSFLNVTTDKVYKNNEWEYGYRENDPLDGFDPYSNSKSCSELVTHAYCNSFFNHSPNIKCEQINGQPKNITRISTARAGNVIGGGDFAMDRIIPDCIRTLQYAYDNHSRNAEIIVRNPHSTRPYQHVLEPLFAYLLIVKAQYESETYADYYNVGPNEYDCITTGELADLFCQIWNDDIFPYAKWCNMVENNAPHEADFLKLDCSKIKRKLGWQPRWDIEKAVEETIRFSKVYLSGGDIETEMDREIEEYIN